MFGRVRGSSARQGFQVSPVLGHKDGLCKCWWELGVTEGLRARGQGRRWWGPRARCGTDPVASPVSLVADLCDSSPVPDTLAGWTTWTLVHVRVQFLDAVVLTRIRAQVQRAWNTGSARTRPRAGGL